MADDEQAITAELGPFLQRNGFDVAIARDGAEALELVAFFKPDLIALDVGSVGVGG